MPGTAVDLWEEKRRKSVFKIQESESEELTCRT
jgi:hypothetical protein